MRSGDQISLASGTVQLTFGRGGQVALHGPIQFRVDSDFQGELISGRLSVFVPEHAVGFTIRAGKISIVDLGTEYQAELAVDASCVVQVFDGLVDIKFEESSKTGEDTMPVSAGRAYRFGTSTDSVQSIDYDESLRLPKSIWSN
jgi:ferric-dicitrate binding protein FerR (iron transport regulator)